MLHPTLSYEYFIVDHAHILELACANDEYQALLAELDTPRANKDKYYRSSILYGLRRIEEIAERELSKGFALKSLGRDFQVSDIFAKIFSGQMPTQPAANGEDHYDAGVSASDTDLALLQAHSIGQSLADTFVPSSYAAQAVLGRGVTDIKAQQIAAAKRKKELAGSSGKPAASAEPAAPAQPAAK